VRFGHQKGRIQKEQSRHSPNTTGGGRKMQVSFSEKNGRKVRINATELRSVRTAAAILREVGRIACDSRAADAAVVLSDFVTEYAGSEPKAPETQPLPFKEEEQPAEKATASAVPF
jgi:hypothetical protein